MEEQLVSFDTAKLAKEKGFDEVCLDTYKLDNKTLINKYIIDYEEVVCEDSLKAEFEIKNSNINEAYAITSPTQALLQKWLREIHGINVISNTDITLSWVYSIQSLHPYASYTGVYLFSMYVYTKYEDALEVALQEALKLINN